MTPRDALLAAADQIENNPERFVFFSHRKPRSDRGYGCALGWVGFFGEVDDVPFPGYLTEVAERFLGTNEKAFYAAMNQLQAGPPRAANETWQLNAELCADALRRYADARYPNVVPLHRGLPDSVRAIFERAEECES